LLNGLVCLVVHGFEFAIRPVVGIRLVMKPAVGKRAAELLVEEQEQERDLHAFGGEPVSVARTIALEQTVALDFV